ncbi:hypothetical protein quinque_014807 [Culex quinquefasciatus]
MLTHIAVRKHQYRLKHPVIDVDIILKISASKNNKSQIHIAPSGPVPPDMATIDRFKEGLVVGIEYVIKLKAPERREPSHHCVLCNKKGDPHTIAVAITIHIHRSMFLNLALNMLREGEKDIPGLTDTTMPRRLGPKRATNIRKLYNLTKFVEKRPLPEKDGKKTKSERIRRRTRLSSMRESRSSVGSEKEKNKAVVKAAKKVTEAAKTAEKSEAGKKAVTGDKKEKKILKKDAAAGTWPCGFSAARRGCRPGQQRPRNAPFRQFADAVHKRHSDANPFVGGRCETSPRQHDRRHRNILPQSGRRPWDGGGGRTVLLHGDTLVRVHLLDSRPVSPRWASAQSSDLPYISYTDKPIGDSPKLRNKQQAKGQDPPQRCHRGTLATTGRQRASGVASPELAGRDLPRRPPSNRRRATTSWW